MKPTCAALTWKTTSGPLQRQVHLLRVLKDDAATKTFIENCADAGADAIIDFKSMSGQMCRICADNDMVYAISGNYIAHPEFLETDYPNFAGAVGSNNAELRLTCLVPG